MLATPSAPTKATSTSAANIPTQAVYGHVPEAWWATVPGRDFGFGECLSLLAEESIRQAVDRIVALLRPHLQ